jgi:hypothetical protein
MDRGFLLPKLRAYVFSFDDLVERVHYRCNTTVAASPQAVARGLPSSFSRD